MIGSHSSPSLPVDHRVSSCGRSVVLNTSIGTKRRRILVSSKAIARYLDISDEQMAALDRSAREMFVLSHARAVISVAVRKLSVANRDADILSVLDGELEAGRQAR